MLTPASETTEATIRVWLAATFGAQDWTVQKSREPLATISQYQLVCSAHLLKLNSAPETIAVANQRIQIDCFA